MKSKTSRVCIFCGESYFPTYRRKREKPQVFCSQKCEKEARWGKSVPRTCAKCGAPAQSTGKRSQKYCSDECRISIQKTKMDALRAVRKFSDESRERSRQARLRQNSPKKMTRIEKMLRDAFNDRNLSFVMHQAMFGRWQPDFVFNRERLIVQADGDYWHSLPVVVERDGRFNEAAKRAAWQVVRFPEHKILNSLQECVSIVMASLAKETSEP